MNFARSLDLFMNTLFLAVHVMDSYMAQRGSTGFVDNAELITIVYSSLMVRVSLSRCQSSELLSAVTLI